MLNLWDPIELEGLTIFRDDVDVRKFYVLPDQPVIRSAEGGVPEFLFIKYFAVAETAEGDKQGGYVQLRASLALSDDRRQRVLDGLRARLIEDKAAGVRPFDQRIVSTEPILASPTWTKGEVKLLTFAPREDGVVTHSAVSALPDLSADLGASVILELDPLGAEIFWTAFDTGQIPIVLAYDVSYLARVPAGSMKIRAKREQVKKVLWERAKPHVWLPQLKIYQALPMPTGVLALNPALLLQLRGIHPGKKVVATVPKKEVTSLLRTTITIESHSGLATDQELPFDIRDQMMTLATELISESLIGPSLLPGTIPGSMSEGGADLAQLADDDETPDSDFTLELSQDGVIERRVAPNGPLGLLVDSARFKDLFIERDPSGDFFRTLEILATTEAVDFEEDGIAMVLVDVRYEEVDDITGETVGAPPNQQSQQRLDGEHPEATWRFRLARRSAGGFKRQYRYRTKVVYRSSQPDSESPWMLADSPILNINPQSLMALRIQLALIAQASEIEAAEVDLRYRTRAGTTFNETKVLTAADAQQTWFQTTGELRANTDPDPEYDYRTDWKLVDIGRIRGEWKSTRDKTLVLPSPFDRTLRYTLQSQGFDATTQHISGSITYEHPEREYVVRKAFQLNAASATTEIAVRTLDGGPSTARIEWRLTRLDGSARNGQIDAVQPGLVWVGPAVAKSIAIEVTPVLLDFEADIKLAVVRLHYSDPANGIEERTTMQFRKDDAGSHVNPQTWTLRLADDTRTAFDLVVDLIGMDNSRTRVEQTGVVDTLVLLERGMGGGN